MYKKIRFYSWFIKGIFNRYQRTIVSFFVAGIILVILGIRLGPDLLKLYGNQHAIIGMVGLYSPTDLPDSVQRLISSGLTDISAAGEAMPAVATKWEIANDGKTYTFTLRNDLYWHDGKKFIAEDINYNLRDVEFVAKNDTTLEVKLKNPFTPLPNYLSKPLFRKGLTGVGSYKVSSIRLKGDTVSYLKLSPLARELKLPILEIKFYSSEEMAKTAFKLGEVTILDQINDPAPFTDWPDLVIKDINNKNRLIVVFFNMNDKLLQSKEFRQALSYAIEKPVKNRIATPLSTLSWAYTNRVKQYEKDLDLAKKLVPESTSSQSELTLSTFAPDMRLAQIIASSWDAIDVATRIKVESGLPTDYQALLATIEIPSDPDQYNLWHSTQAETNITHYVNPKIDKLLEDGRKEQDIEIRKKIYFDFQRYLVDDAPAVFLFHPVTYTISRK